MKKKLQILALTLLALTTSYAQTPTWQWASSAGGSLEDNSNSIVTDSSGNVYVTGNFKSSTIVFGNDTLNNDYPGTNNFFIAKYSNTGNVIWAKTADGNNDDRGDAIAVDQYGNIYVTGFFQSDSIKFGNVTLQNNGSSDIFLVKYDNSGVVVWAENFGGTLSDAGKSLCSKNNAIYLTGSFASPTIIFGGTTLNNSTAQSDIFIVKLDSQGNPLWAKNSNCAGISAKCITYDLNGNLYITGYFSQDSLNLDNHHLTNINPGQPEIFITKYDTLGNSIWAKSVNGIGADYANSICTDHADNIYITGHYYSSIIDFGGVSLNNSSLATQADIFITKYNESGNLIWAKNFGGKDDESCWGIASDLYNNIYLTGFFESDTIFLGSSFILNPNINDVPCFFVTKADSSGNLDWGLNIGDGSNLDFIEGHGICIDNSNNVFITGYFNENPAIFGNDTLNTLGNSYDMFIAAINDCVIPDTTSILGQTSFCVDTTTSLAIYASPVFLHTKYSWSGPSGFSANTQSINSISTAGQYYCTINNGLGCSVTLDKNIIVNPLPNVTINSTNDTLCFGQSVILNVSGANTYSWNNSVSNGVAFNPISTNTYIVTGTDTNGCSNTAAQTIVVNPLPIPIINQNGNDLSCQSFLTYQWFVDSLFIPFANNQIHTPLMSGNYTVLVEDSNGCSNFSSGYQVTVTDIKNLNSATTINIFPNPFSDIFTLQILTSNQENVSITLYNISGEVIKENLIISNRKIEFNNSDLPSGMYFLQTKISNGDIKMIKIIKK